MLAAGFPRRAVSAGALLFLLVEALRAFQGPWDPVGVLSLTAALLLYLLRPAKLRPAGGLARSRHPPVAPGGLKSSRNPGQKLSSPACGGRCRGTSPGV